MSLQIMTDSLRRDIYHLRHHGFPANRVEVSNTDPLAPTRYACIYWVDHLHGCDHARNAPNELPDGGPIDKFLRRSYFYWLEALSLLRSMPEGIELLLRLKDLLQVSFSLFV